MTNRPAGTLADRPAVRAMAMRRVAAVVDVDVLQRLGEMPDVAEVGVVAGGLAGQQGVQGVVEVVAPGAVEAVAAVLARHRPAADR